jgi:hypothetical protein
MEKEISEKLVQVYCLPQHSHKELDANLVKDMTTALTSLFKAKMLEMIGGDKNFNSEVCMWRDDADMVKEVRGLCKGYNQAKAELRKKVEGV